MSEPSSEDLRRAANAILRADDHALEQAIRSYQELIWDSELAEIAEDQQEVFRTLAYDLDFFEPDAKQRAADTSYYGPERAREEVRAVLETLRR